MAHLACWSCGRRVYATVAIEALFVDERRCPRCGALLNLDRREMPERRQDVRRQNTPADPAPPSGMEERRVEERRKRQRRRGSS